MRCPYCGHDDSKVIDSRSSDGGVRRRRQCLACAARFTTLEQVQRAGLLVVKKDGRREEFSREKVLAGVRKACAKRPIAAAAMEALVDQVEAACHAQGRAEIPASFIGELVMERLRELDHIAYIRFASVYRAFADVEELKAELAALERPVTANQPPLLPPQELETLARQPRLQGWGSSRPKRRRISSGS